MPLLPFIRDEFNLDYTQAGVVIAAFSLAYGISQLPAGWLADRIGPRTLVTIGIAGVAIAGVLVGLSQTYIMLLVFLVLMGILGGGYHPASAPLVSASVEPKNRGWALGLHLIGGNASFFVAPLIAAATAATWGWRSPFIIVAIPTFILGIFFYIYTRQLTNTTNTSHSLNNSHNRTRPAQQNLRQLASVMTLSIFNFSIIVSIISFIPLFMVDQLGFSREAAAALISVYYSVGLWASPLGGYLSDRLGRLSVILSAAFITGPSVYMLNLVPPGLGVVAVLIIIGMSHFIIMPVAEAYIIGRTSERNRSSILGIYYFGSMGGIGVITPLIGYLIDKSGFYLSFTVTAVALVVVTLVCSILLKGSHN